MKKMSTTQFHSSASALRCPVDECRQSRHHQTPRCRSNRLPKYCRRRLRQPRSACQRCIHFRLPSCTNDNRRLRRQRKRRERCSTDGRRRPPASSQLYATLSHRVFNVCIVENSEMLCNLTTKLLNVQQPPTTASCTTTTPSPHWLDLTDSSKQAGTGINDVIGLRRKYKRETHENAQTLCG